MPSELGTAGNVLYGKLKYRISVRTAPTQSSKDMEQKLRRALVEAPVEVTYGAKVSFELVDECDGICMPDLKEDMKRAVLEATCEAFDGREPVFYGDGGAIPFMTLFSEEFPEANFILTGVLQPTGNAHCADENLDLEYTRKFTNMIALTLSKL